MDKQTQLRIAVECKDLILEYQQTRNKEVFQLILMKLDKYLLYLIYKFRNRYPHLKREELQELYHIAILGLHQGILTLHADWRPEKIYLWVGSYIKNSFRRSFSYRRHEFSLDQKIVEFNEDKDEHVSQIEESKERYCNSLNQLDLRMLLQSNVFSDEEREYLELRFYKNYTLNEIAEIKGLSKVAVHKKLNKILEKLKEKLELENKGDEI